MKQEQLKKLAEWMELSHNEIGGRIVYDEQADGWVDKTWQPHKDSNQLDMLEDKLILESEYDGIYLHPNGEGGWSCSYCVRNTPEFLEARGKTKNEARLNAIINYVEGLK